MLVAVLDFFDGIAPRFGSGAVAVAVSAVILLYLRPKYALHLKATRKAPGTVHLVAAAIFFVLGVAFVPTSLHVFPRALVTMTSYSLLAIGMIRLIWGASSLTGSRLATDLVGCTTAWASLLWALFPREDFLPLLSPSYVFGMPVALISGTLHLRWLLSEVSPRYLSLVDHRLLSTAYPEAQLHTADTSPRGRASELSVFDLVRGTVIICAMIAALLTGAWIGQYELAAGIYAAVVIVAGLAAMLPLPLWKRHRLPNCLRAILGGGGMIMVPFFLFRLAWPIPREEIGGLRDVFTRSLAFSAPLVLAIGGLWDLRIHATTLGRLQISKLLRDQKTISDAVHYTLFRDNEARKLMAVLLGGILVLYLTIPHSQEILKTVGLQQIGATTVDEAIGVFRQYSDGWEVPGLESGESMGRFILGNQGLVLLYMLWSGVSIMRLIVAYGRLEKLILPCHNRIDRALPALSIIAFLVYLLPFFLIVVLSIPVMFANLFQNAASIVIGAFAFNLLVPRVMAFVWSLVVFLVGLWLCRGVTDYR